MSDEERKSPTAGEEPNNPVAEAPVDTNTTSALSVPTDEQPTGGAKDVPAETAAKSDNQEPQASDAQTSDASDSDAPTPKKAPRKTTKAKPTVEGAVNPISAVPEALDVNSDNAAATPTTQKADSGSEVSVEAQVTKPAAKGRKSAAAKTEGASAPEKTEPATDAPAEDAAPKPTAKPARKTAAARAEATPAPATTDTATPAPEAAPAAPAADEAATPAPEAAPVAPATAETATPSPKAAPAAPAAADTATPAPKPAPKPAPAAAPAAAAAAAAAADGAAAKPAPPKKAAPPPDPRAEEAKAKAETIKAAIVAKLGGASVEEVGAAHFKPMVRIRREDWLNAVELLRTHADWQLNYLECMAGVDYPEYIELVVYIQSTTLGHFVCLKTRTERENAEVPSLVSVHPGVNWEEREIYDLLGVTFTGHPDLRRIMMWDEFKGHPLRKDYSAWD